MGPKHPISFTFRNKPYSIYISEVNTYPQAYAAAMTVYSMIRDLPRAFVVDIGGFTADYLLLKKGNADLSVCDSLENGVITADSMTARGYGVGPRSRFSIFRWFLGDTLLLLGSLLLTALTIAGLSATSVAYYPRFTLPAPTPLCIAGYAAYGLLTLLPLIFQAKEAWKWHCLRSSI
jgi:hypothetical protein